ncbi:MAG: Flp family type IVb pilin [Candidatus Sericytochromatia bacterium]|nr:Flp family type IVb pilin [Candidatus Sericytochromatia bacterium]
MKNLILNLFKDEDGQGMVEYGIIIALISVVAIVAVKSIGNKVNTDGYDHASKMMDVIPAKK